MKLYVERCGSGFGGYYGKYIVDLDTNSYSKFEDADDLSICGIDIDKERLFKFNHITCAEKLEKDYSDLSCLSNVKLVKTPVSFDGQIDKVVAIDGDNISLVHSPYDIPFICVEDDGLRNKICELIDELSNITPKLDTEPTGFILVPENNTTFDMSNCRVTDILFMSCCHATEEGVKALTKAIAESLMQEE